jgi:hypothetical protein
MSKYYVPANIRAIGKNSPDLLRRAIEAAQWNEIGSGWIYLGTTVWQTHKIGKTYDLAQRFKGVRLTHGVMKYRHTIHCRYYDLVETAFHALFSPYQTGQGREIFLLPDAEVDWFCSLHFIHGGHIAQYLEDHLDTNG